MEAKRGMYENIVAPMLLNGYEAWVVNVASRRRLEAVEMMSEGNVWCEYNAENSYLGD